MNNLDTSGLTRFNGVAAAVLAALFVSPAAMAATTKTQAPANEAPATSQDPLLNTLLKNGVINKKQYQELAKSGQNFSDNALLAVLAQNGAITKDQAKTLSGGKVEGAAPAAAAGAAPAIKNAPAPNPNDGYARVNEKGIEWGSNDGAFKAKIGGRIQVDSEINWNTNNPNATNGTQAAALSDGMALRRARLFVEGLMYRDYEYRFEYDFVRNNGGVAGITDAYMKYIHFAPFALTIGQTNEGKSAESVMSNNYLSFIERSLPNNAFIEASTNSKYQMGAIGEYFEKAWGVPYVLRGGITTEGVGVAGPGSSSMGNQGTSAASGANNNWYGTTSNYANGSNRNNWSPNTTYQMVGRGVVLPYKDDDGNLVHTGVWGSYRSITNQYYSNGTLRSGGWQFASAADTDVDRSNIINTTNLTNQACYNQKTHAFATAGAATTGASCAAGYSLLNHAVNDINMFGAELLGAWGPFWTHNEYMMTQVNGVGYSSADLLQGLQTSAGWFITGETRPYDEKKGTWNRVIPKANFLNGGGWGAWEVAARYDLMNMNTKHINGGDMDIFTLGVNWYLTPRVRMMSNWVHVLAINTGAPGSMQTGGSSCGVPSIGGSVSSTCWNGQTPNIWETAVRVDF
jgi:phosphate-selective porin OprO/OprP